MTDNNPGVVQDAGQPTPTIQPQTSMSNSPSVEDLTAKLLEALTPKLDELITRKVQSTKDKRFSKIEGGIGDIQQILAEAKELKGKGLNDDQVEDKMLLRRLVESLSVTAEAPGQAQPVVGDHARKILSDAGIAENDPDAVELARKSYASEAERVTAFASLAIQRTRKPQPNPAQVVQTAPANVPNVDLAAEHLKEIIAAKGDLRAIVEIDKKYRRLGLQV